MGWNGLKGKGKGMVWYGTVRGDIVWDAVD